MSPVMILDVVVLVVLLIDISVTWRRTRMDPVTRELITKLETQIVQCQTLTQRALYELSSLRAEVSSDNHEDTRRFDKLEESVGKHELTLTRYASDLKVAIAEVKGIETKVAMATQNKRGPYG